MTQRTLIRRSLRFHWRSHLGVVLGAAIGSAALIGALIVGDSVRESLRERALARLGGTFYAMDAGDRLFRDDLNFRIALKGVFPTNQSGPRGSIRFFSTSILRVHGTAANAAGSARANAVNIYGVRSHAFGETNAVQDASSEVTLNEPLARQLGVKPGDEVLLRVRKPESISADSPVSVDEQAVALRLLVASIAGDDETGNLSLNANQTPPYNAFLDLAFLQSKLDVTGRANLVLGGPVQSEVTARDESLLKEAGRRIQPEWRWTRANWINTDEALPAREALAYLRSQLQRKLAPEDLQLRFLALSNPPAMEVRSDRIFMEPEVAMALATVSNLPPAAATPTRILTYLINQIRAGTNTTPYSMVSALEPPLLPADLKDDEVIINQWLAEDLSVQPGAEIALTYFAPDQVAQLIERTNTFRVRSIVPMTHRLSDRTLMPDFPGVAKAERAGDWETSFPLVHKIRPKDDEYWQQYRGTPKAFITLTAGQKLWANRFGDVTAVRITVNSNAVAALNDVELALRRSLSTALTGVHIDREPPLSPAQLGFDFRPVRQEALSAASQSQDFGGLFIGFSIFLIAAALILMGLLFAFGLQQRAAEIGTLLALGFRAKQVRKLFLLEGTALAFIGSVIGVLGGIFYARAMLHGLTTIWRSATNASALTFHLSPVTVIIGLVSGTLVAVVTIWLVLRRQARQPARSLLAGESGSDAACAPALSKNLDKKRSRPVAALQKLLREPVIAWTSLALAVGILGFALSTGQTTNAGIFFGAGSLALIAGLAFTSMTLRRLVGPGVLTAADEASESTTDSESSRGARGKAHPTTRLSAAALSMRGAARRRMRSVATVALLACGVFLIVAIGAFRLDAEADAWKRSSGTGGFAFIAESTLPIIKDLNTAEGRDALGLNARKLEGVSFVPFRVREGDDASCLNLNRAQQPRLLGVNPTTLSRRAAFSFAKGNGWKTLQTSDSTVDAIGDAASIQWALKKKIGDTLPYTDERGNAFKVRLVGGLANSILQGSLIIDEAEFTRRFPGVSGYRMFLIDAPSNRVQEVSAELTRALQDYGFEVTPAAQRLAQFNAVQNTYLSTFQVLGGLGLLLGSFGLGIVVLRNVLERRGELALLVAVGFRRARVQKLVLGEHAVLLWLGLLIGIVAALLAILPSILSPRAELPLASLALTLGGVLLFGLVSTWLATRASVRGNLLEGLRNE